MQPADPSMVPTMGRRPGVLGRGADTACPEDTSSPQGPQGPVGEFAAGCVPLGSADRRGVTLMSCAGRVWEC